MANEFEKRMEKHMNSIDKSLASISKSLERIAKVKEKAQAESDRDRDTIKDILGIHSPSKVMSGQENMESWEVFDNLSKLSGTKLL